MWMFSKDGFFSVVKNQYCAPGDLAVRARVKSDLVNFCKATKTPVKKIVVTKQADYRFRVHVTQALWAEYAAQMAGEIDYGNFKNETCSGVTLNAPERIMGAGITFVNCKKGANEP